MLTHSRLHSIALVFLCLVPVLLATARAGADAAVCIVGILFLIHSAKSKDWRWFARTDIRLLMALWVWLLIASAFSGEPEFALMSAAIWGRMVLFYAAITSWILIEPAHFTWLKRTVFFLLALVVVDTAWQYIHGVSLSGHVVENARLTGPLRSPNIGNFLFKVGLPIVAIGFYQWFSTGQKYKLYALIAGALIIMALVMLSGERSIAILMLLSLSIMTAAVTYCWPQMRRMAVLSFGMVLAIIMALIGTQEVVRDRMAVFIDQLGYFWDTNYGRLFTAAYELFMQHPFMGIGAKQFRNMCDQVAIDVAICTNLHPHNFYLEWLSSTGIIGFALWIAALVFIVKAMLKRALFSGVHSIPTIVSIGFLSALLFPIIGTQSAFSNWPGILFWYSVSLAVCLPRIVEKR